MTPAYELICNGKDVTANFDGRLASIAVTDESGDASDTLTIEVEDTAGAVVMPARNMELRLKMGYSEEGLRDFGRFYVDTCEEDWRIAARLCEQAYGDFKKATDSGVWAKPDYAPSFAHASPWQRLNRSALLRDYDEIPSLECTLHWTAFIVVRFRDADAKRTLRVLAADLLPSCAADASMAPATPDSPPGRPSSPARSPTR